MTKSYTVLWTNDHCQRLKKAGDEGKKLNVVFGGIHLSAPSFRKARVESGDFVYPLRVYKGTLFVVARLKIKTYISLEEYVVQFLGLSAEEISGLYEYQIKELVGSKFPCLGQELPYGCGIEVLLGEEGTPIRLDNAVLPAQLEAITFCSKRGRQGLKFIENGRIKNTLSLQGNIRCLCPESAKYFEGLVS